MGKQLYRHHFTLERNHCCKKADLHNIFAFAFGILNIFVAVILNAMICLKWAELNNQEVQSSCVDVRQHKTSLVLSYESEDNEVTYTDQFVFVRSTHTRLVHFCWTSLLSELTRFGFFNASLRTRMVCMTLIFSCFVHGSCLSGSYEEIDLFENCRFFAVSEICMSTAANAITGTSTLTGFNLMQS